MKPAVKVLDVRAQKYSRKGAFQATFSTIAKKRSDRLRHEKLLDLLHYDQEPWQELEFLERLDAEFRDRRIVAVLPLLSPANQSIINDLLGLQLFDNSHSIRELARIIGRHPQEVSRALNAIRRALEPSSGKKKMVIHLRSKPTGRIEFGRPLNHPKFSEIRREMGVSTPNEV